MLKVKVMHYTETGRRVNDNKKFSRPAICYYLIGEKDYGCFDFCFKDSSNPLSRILQYVEDTGCVIISASKDKYKSQNVDRAHQLEMDLRSKGFGYRPSIGGGFPEEAEDGSVNEIESELSFIVPKPKDMDDLEFLNIMMGLGKKYEQDDITVALKSINNGKPCWINTSDSLGEVDLSFNRMRQTKQAGEDKDQYYTQEKRHGKMFSLVDSVKKDINGKEYRIRTCDDISLADVIGYYTRYRIMPHFDKRCHGEYNYDYANTGFFIKK